MNILQINTVDNRGGAAKIAYLLKQGLAKKGHETHMLVGRKYSSDNNVNLITDMMSFPGKVRRKLAYWLANDIDIFYSEKLLKTAEFKNANIVHLHNLHSNYFNLGILKKISALKPVVWTLHDMWPLTSHCAHAFDGKIQSNGFFACPSTDIYPPIAWHNEKYLEKRKSEIYKNSEFQIVTPSKWLQVKVKESILKDKPLSVIYNGVNTSSFKPYDRRICRKELGLPENKKIILVVAKKGRSNPWKGGNYAQNIIKNFANRPDVFFVDLGGNSEQDSTHLKTVGYVSDMIVLAKYYSAADILLYPSIADNCPLVVLEAMACGLPVCAFQTGGIPELVGHKIHGYLAEYKNEKELKNGLEYLLNLPFNEIEKMKANSVGKVRDSFTTSKMVDQYLSLYEKVIEDFNS